MKILILKSKASILKKLDRSLENYLYLKNERLILKSSTPRSLKSPLDFDFLKSDTETKKHQIFIFITAPHYLSKRSEIKLFSLYQNSIRTSLSQKYHGNSYSRSQIIGFRPSD